MFRIFFLQSKGCNSETKFGGSTIVVCDTIHIPIKGALSWYGKLTWESAHAWNLIILCLLIVWGMTFIFMVHLSFYTIPLLIYDVMYDITTIP